MGNKADKGPPQRHQFLFSQQGMVPGAGSFYSIDQFGNVYFAVNARLTPIAQNTAYTLGTLPVGFRPIVTTSLTCFTRRSSPFEGTFVISQVIILSTGQVTLYTPAFSAASIDWVTFNAWFPAA